MHVWVCMCVSVQPCRTRYHHRPRHGEMPRAVPRGPSRQRRRQRVGRTNKCTPIRAQQKCSDGMARLFRCVQAFALHVDLVCVGACVRVFIVQQELSQNRVHMFCSRTWGHVSTFEMSNRDLCKTGAVISTSCRILQHPRCCFLGPFSFDPRLSELTFPKNLYSNLGLSQYMR